MQKFLNTLLTILLILFIFPHTNAASEEEKMTSKIRSLSKRSIFLQAKKARSFYDLGVFAYEDGNYKGAENNLKEAIKIDPNNPLYNHYLGKIYMKIGSYQAAKKYLSMAFNVNPDVPELKFDLAFLNYKMGKYSMASNLFLEIIKENPSNLLAYYYAGINLFEQKLYKKALKYFIHASQESSSIKTNGYYYIGICFLKTGKIKESIEKLEYVRDHAEPGPLKENALEWIKTAKMQEKASKPYSIYFKIGYKYDNNIKFDIEDLDIYTEEDAYFYFSGKFDFFRSQDYKVGIGYNHYQTWDSDANKYDLTGSIFNLYSMCRFHSFTLRFSYLPYYYRLDSDSYVMRHQLRPEIIKKINKDLIAKFSYSYYHNNYYQYNEKDGHTNEIFLDVYYTILNEKADLCAGVGYADNTSSHSDHYYNQLKTKLGISLKIPWELNLCLTARYYKKAYNNIDSAFGIKRDDNKYYGSIALSRKIFYPWLDIIAGFDYTKNDSNINDYEYDRRVASLSLSASF